MTASTIWQDIGAGENVFTKVLRLLFLVVAAVIFIFLAIVPLTWPQQAVLGLISLVIALALARGSDSYLVTLTLMMLSMFCTFRYGYWRIDQVIRFFRDPANHWGALDAFFILCLLLAEAYAFVILFLGYFQTIWPLRRAPVSLPENPEDWPDVDVLIPTFNEPLDVVRFTALGALNMDWPADKLHVYILDDGRRKEFEEFAFEAGVGYRTRPDNKFAKAGNINTALETMASPLVAVFDSDHVPTRSFLQMTVGWFLRDPKLAVMQTPHHFYSPDPFERNLRQFHVIPNEGELFYGVVQDGNDFWNSSFFCGSCAVLRRSALDEIGGIAKETVTEDAHTSLRMQMAGWNTAYINIPQAAGLATERLSAHVGQRIRWARGMIQVLRTDNPLFARGLKFPQRLCYFNAVGHFLYAVPRLVFLTAPLIYLLLNHTNIPGFWAAILAYALPHLTLSNVTNSRIQGDHRHSFWNEIYETVLSPYILLPTMMALINPRLGKFNVTAKGGVVRRTFFDSRIAQPFLVMLIFNIAGLLVAIPRFFTWDTTRRGTVLMNVAWCIFNIIILGVCTAVARELMQRRTTVRIKVARPLLVKLPDGIFISGEAVDMSNGGAGILLGEAVELAPDAIVHLQFNEPPATNDLHATVVSVEDSILRVRFDDLSIAEQEVLTVQLYSRADAWLGWGEGRESDNVLRSLGRIFTISMRGLKATALSLFGRDARKARSKSTSLSIAQSGLILLLGTVLVCGSPKSLAQAAAPNPANPANAASVAVLPGQYHDMFTLADAGAPQLELHSIDRQHSIYFTLPQTHVVRTATIHVYYAFSPALIPQLSQLKFILNGTLFGTIQPKPGKYGGSDGSDSEADLAIPPELLVHQNTLTVEFIGHYTMSCEDPSNTSLWARVDRKTRLDVFGDLLPLADDLKQLPIPFVDPAVIQPVSIPVVFPAQPSFKAIQAAGIVTSYFGMVSADRPVRFPVRIGGIPQGNVIVVAENPASLPTAFNLSSASGPTVAMRTNPNDPYGKILIVTGPNADAAIVAAQAVALHSDMLIGTIAPINNLALPAKQAPDAAPRWARTDQTIQLWDYATTSQLQGDGTAPLNVYFRIPPDLYYETGSDNTRLHLAYRYNSIPIGPISSLQVRVNSAFLGSTPLVPGQDPWRTTTTDVPVPVVNLRPFSNTLSFDYTFQLARKEPCATTTPINLQGSILRDSYLDLRGYPHWTPLPNLEIFSNAGFPFTRLADLSGTTVVLPLAPTEQEIETFVTLMGHFGRQTGFPGLRVTVAGPEALQNGAATDFLIIGSGDDQPAFETLGRHLPVSLGSGQIQVRDTEGFFVKLLHNAWWKLSPGQHDESGELTAGGTPDAIIEGIESPYDIGGSRSIVAIHLRDASTFEPFISTFLAVQQSSDISGSVSVLHGEQFQSFRVGSEVYYVGSLPWWTQLRLWAAEYPWLIAIIVVLLAFLVAIWTRQWLRAHARARLTMMEG
ncbi:MAG TPA: UDP-forming cellulose synthase catalytic subunit [Terracidiphilus sp.]|nr:UDP-forming cellulose synthase catalytic subunit [Terracidiphilus sp.]